jgi:hypothetical protein
VAITINIEETEVLRQRSENGFVQRISGTNRAGLVTVKEEGNRFLCESLSGERRLKR